MQTEVLELPWQVQLALASGYIGYVVAFIGVRRDHQTHDVVFLTLVFSLVASAASFSSKSFIGSEIVRALFAITITVLVAGLWRKWGCVWWQALLRGWNISHSDNAASALGGLRVKTDAELTGVAVLLRDGSWLMCDDTSIFSKCVYPPFTIGENGDVLMYVSSQTAVDGTDKKLPTTLNKDFGDRLTYIPVDQIARLNMRFRKALIVPRRRWFLLTRLGRRSRTD